MAKLFDRGHLCQAFISLASAYAFPGAQLGSQNHTSIRMQASSKQPERGGSTGRWTNNDDDGREGSSSTAAAPAPEKAVVVPAAAAEWPSGLQRDKCIQISILNANTIIIRLVYQNAYPITKPNHWTTCLQNEQKLKKKSRYYALAFLQVGWTHAFTNNLLLAQNAIVHQGYLPKRSQPGWSK